MTTHTMNFVLYFQATWYRREKKINSHTFCWFPGLFFPQCKHTQNPVLKSPTSSSCSHPLPCAVLVLSASSMPQPIHPLTASFLPKPFHPVTLPPSPGPSHKRLNGGWHLKASWLVTSRLLSHGSAEHPHDNQCVAQVHNWKQNCRFGEPNIFYRGCCLTEVVPVPQWIFLWSITLPTKNKYSNVLDTAEVKGKTTMFRGCQFKPSHPVTK